MIRHSIYSNETVESLRDQVRRFVDLEVKPHASAWEEAGKVPREVLRKMGELGFFGIRYPEKFGGAEMDTLATVAFVEELSRSTYAGFNITALVHTDMASPHLARFGTPQQLERYMPDVVAGRLITGVAVTEPGGGSDVQALRTVASRRGDGWVLNGTKIFITNGVYGDLFFVAARTDPDAKSSRGVSMFIVERNTPGFSVGRKLDKMGWRSSDTAELVFQDCELAGDALLGEENRGFYAIMKNFQNERIVLGAMAVGESQAAIDLTLEYVKGRTAFGATLWDKQAIRQRLAMLQAEVEAARQLTYHAAWLDARGADATREVSMVKALCGELVNRVTYACQQFHGGYGYMREYPIERMVRDARVQAVGGGATEVMLEEIAKRM
ncbi:MAG: acyl-CoA dehydrogenase family protein [Reyranella sp.]|nr:acyl-CoA dehydrogenase family protein [Reyranella sp.]MDP3159605.1 acyl-CoA dehydrogenase family protein [Reyranella sp.]